MLCTLEKIIVIGEKKNDFPKNPLPRTPRSEEKKLLNKPKHDLK